MALLDASFALAPNGRNGQRGYNVRPMLATRFKGIGAPRYLG